MQHKPIKVLLVDDHLVARNGVKLMLAPASDIEIVGEASSAAEALQLTHTLDADVALIDISMQDKSGLDLLKVLRKQTPQLHILILSMYAEEIYGIRAFKLGALGYLTKNVNAAVLANAVRKVASGNRYISPAIAERLVDILNGSENQLIEKLSNREIQILKLIAKGTRLGVIASTLHISASTVATHRKSILRKTGRSSNVDLAHYAREIGILE